MADATSFGGDPSEWIMMCEVKPVARSNSLEELRAVDGVGADRHQTELVTEIQANSDQCRVRQWVRGMRLHSLCFSCLTVHTAEVWMP